MMRPLARVRRFRHRRGRNRLAVCTWCSARLQPGQWQCAPGYGCRALPLTQAEVERLFKP